MKHLAAVTDATVSNWAAWLTARAVETIRPLGDRSAREFMARFYRTWLNGPKPKDLAVALRETQLSFIQNENESLRDPRVWAPFVLVEGP